MSKIQSQEVPTWAHHRVSDDWISTFNQLYERPGRPDWELLPLEDLTDFVKQISINEKFVKRVLDIGCGSGKRLCYLIEYLSQKGAIVEALGIDVSPVAIEIAIEEHKKYKFGGNSVPKPKLKPVARRLTAGRSSVVTETKVEFQCREWAQFPAVTETQFDIVIDWMCFHEQRMESHLDYVSFVASVCKRFFILKVFHETPDGPETPGLLLDTVKKTSFRKAEIEKLFLPHFWLLSCQEEASNANPDPPHTDGAVHAKISFCFVKRIPGELAAAGITNIT